MAITGHTVSVAGGGDITIYGETANINYFLATPLEADALQGPTNSATTVASSSRRQYPGDTTTINVSSNSREFLVDPSRKSGNALPGRNFALKERGGNEEFRSFTLKGRVMDLHAFLSGEAGKNMFLYTASGARYTIDVPAGA
jgi:hypothetical protein